MTPEEGEWYWLQLNGEAFVAQWSNGDWWTCGSEESIDTPDRQWPVEVLCKVEPPRGKDGCEACLAGDCSTHAGGDWAIPE